jgi:hypothetical protein
LSDADMLSGSMEVVVWNVETRTFSLSVPSPKDVGFIYDRSIFFSIIASVSSLSALINHSKIAKNMDRFMYARFFVVGFDQSVECWSYTYTKVHMVSLRKIVQGPRATGWTVGVQFWLEEEIILLLSVMSGAGARPAVCPMAIRDFFIGNKLTDTWK